MRGSVLVVGGGIGGLAAAIALERAPLSITIIEQRPREAPDGTGIAISPGGLRALDQLECADVVRAHGRSVSHVIVADQSGKQLGILRPDDPARETTLMISRALIIEALRARLTSPIRQNTELVALRPRAKHVEAMFKDGTRGRYDVVVGADGAHSRVRPYVTERARPAAAGIRCWRFLVADNREKRDTVEYLGPGRRLGVIPLRGRETYVFATADVRDVRPNGGEKEFRRLFDSFEPAWNFVYGVKRAYRVDDLQMILHPALARGRVALVGDAAHLMLPNIAQGATLALEDAILLASLLRSESEAVPALRAYADRRMDTIRRLTAASDIVGWLAHARSPAVRLLRDMALGFTAGPDRTLSRFFAWACYSDA
jgi:2-polyprenyl-6-methoxyphenol hydroxylase-like FAD-dependent oxidoreductase